MNTRILNLGLGAVLSLWLVGCATKPYDYTNYRAHMPHSILVLPPINQSTAIEGTYGYYSTVTFPLAEQGYYVYPIAVVDQFLKENGMPTAGEMHQVPLNKVSEIIGADAILYLTLNEYGTKYQLINSATIVSVTGKLVDVKTGTTLWEGTGAAQENSGGSGNPIADLVAAAVSQAINSSIDHAHAIAPMANNMLIHQRNGMLLGPRHPEFGKDTPK
ncbi:MAG TPA: GNA1162 family protein [Candidatus Paceibacterota bacterium]|nr:GNA1162 family protein [Candidatus Paceibacterota bacterium]